MDGLLHALLTFAQSGAVIQALVVVLVLGTEGRVVVIAKGVPAGVPAVVAKEKSVAVLFVAEVELGVFCISNTPLPVLKLQKAKGKCRLRHGLFRV